MTEHRVAQAVSSPVRLAPPVLRRLLEFACRAPSVYNTQPWAWRLLPGGAELWADRTRALPVADPVGRMLTISCGAALHHLQVAGRALGWDPRVDRLPDPESPDLLARVEFDASIPPPGAAGELTALRHRLTDRRRFTSWPVPVERLERLALVAEDWDCSAQAIGDATDRFRLELLLARALREQGRDPAIQEELLAWLDRGDRDGVPTQTVPDRPGPDPSHATRFGTGTLVDDDRDLEGTDGLVVLGGDADRPLDWLRCGEGLSAMWLRATTEGLSLVPLSQVIEVPGTRDALVHEVLRHTMVPHIVVRIGWQAISRSTVPVTPRRPLDDVLLP